MSKFEKFFVNKRLMLYWHRFFGFGRFLRELPDDYPKQILEVGSGVGFTTEMVSKKYPNSRIIGTDFEETQIEIAKEKYNLPNITFQQEDATRLSFPDNHFDTAFSILVLHHIYEFPTAIKELARVLKPGGMLYIMDIPTKSFNPFHMRRSIVPGVFSKNELIQLLVDNGFEVKYIKGLFIITLECRKKGI